jgi:exodeoxyribonuclease VII small subunit
MTTKPKAGAVPPDIAGMSFEDAMAALEEIVLKLESGQAKLEESIALYDRGAALRRHCEARLADAEMRVQKIVAGEGGAPALEAFPTD